MRRIPSRRAEIFFLEICFVYMVVISLALLLAVFSMAGSHLFDEPDSFLDELRHLLMGVLGGSSLEGETAPDFTLTTLGGDTFTLSEVVGKKVVIINFFATWCAPCKEEMPSLTLFHQAHQDRSLVLLGISNETRPKVEAFVEEHGITFPIGIDRTQIGKLYEIEVLPTTVLVGADGRIHQHLLGAITDTNRALGEAVKSNLALLETDKSPNGFEP